MTRKIKSQFLADYVLMIIISTLIGLFSFMLLGFAGDVIAKTLVKNTHTAESLMQDDYKKIDPTPVVEDHGGVQVINTNHEVVFSEGLNTLTKDKLTTTEFTEFLIKSKSIRLPYSYSIEYNEKGHFWLIVTFPTSIRMDLDFAYNKDFTSVDKKGVVGVIVAVVLFYLILLALCTIIYSKISSSSIISPLKKLCNSARLLKDGDYSSRVDLNLKNEFGELESIFNEMAQQIEQQMSLRMQSEENRKNLILDISHDLKTPLASIMGYVELSYNTPDISKEQQDAYMKVIYENSMRANHLITDLFELSKMESSEYVLNKTSVDICEYMRRLMGGFIATFDNAGFTYNFDIPEDEIFVEIDVKQMDRVFQNLVENSVKYNPKGTNVGISISEQSKVIEIIFKDNGIGIAPETAKNIFKSFVRADRSRNSETGGTGLGLAIVEKIIVAHGGIISLDTNENCGCEFMISIPKI